MKMSRLLLTTAMIASMWQPLSALAADGAKPAKTENAKTLEEAFLKGNFGAELRYRYQFLDDEGFDKDAHASTLRALLKYETKPLYGVSVLGEVRSVQRLGNGDLFNDSINGNTDRPVIADPDAFEIDQALIKFNDIIPDTQATIGRRKIALNNQRFISTLPFRQNSNSFDGAVLENWSLPNTYLHYSYAYNFNRAFTDDSLAGNFDEADIHLVHAEHTYDERLKLIAYAYLLGIEEDSFTNASALATNTYGINAKGKFDLDKGFAFHYDVEYAYQDENSDNDIVDDISLDYYRIQPGLSYNNWRFNLGYEVLEGDGTRGFSTPLALLHAFNGFADVFVNTPANGLEDAYVNVSYNLKKSGIKIGDYDVFGNTKFHIAYHDFEAENGGGEYGDEFDASIKKKLTDNLTLALEYAHYDADFDGTVTSGTASPNRDRDQFYAAFIFKY